MAEAYLRALAGDRFEVASAGTAPTRVHPLAVRVMQEVGLDLTGHTAKGLDRVAGEPWDWVITVCDAAAAACPVVPGATRRLHWPFEDPAAAAGPEEAQLEVFRRVRDGIRARIEAWLAGR